MTTTESGLVLSWSSTTVRTELAGADPYRYPVVVEDVSGERRFANLAEALANDDALILRPDTEITLLGRLADDYAEQWYDDDPTCNWPFKDGQVRADPAAWAGTRTNWFDEESDWIVMVNGHRAEFSLDVCLLAAPRISPDSSGKLLEWTTDEASMTTGEIGLTVRVDAWGGIWINQWGYIEDFLGIGNDTDLVEQIRRTHDGGEYGPISEARSELLTCADLVALLGRFVQEGTVEVPDDCLITGRDCSEYWEDLIEQ